MDRRTLGHLMVVAALMCALALSAPARAAGDLTDPHEILAKHYEAIGGLERLREERTVHFVADLSVTGLSGTLENWEVRPDRSRQDIDLGARQVRCSGEQVKLESPVGEEDDSEFGMFIEDELTPPPSQTAYQNMLTERVENYPGYVSIGGPELVDQMTKQVANFGVEPVMGAQVTALRRRVLTLVWDSHKPIGAYDILDKLGGEGKAAAPPTVYRALDFLLDHGLIHREPGVARFDQPQHRIGGHVGIALHVPEPAPTTIGILLQG